MANTAGKSASRRNRKKALAEPKKRKKKSSYGEEVEERIFKTLLDVMSDSESDSVRVAAAKALMDRMLRGNSGNESSDDVDNRERQALVAELQSALAEIAAAKSGGGGGEDAMDTQRTA